MYGDLEVSGDGGETVLVGIIWFPTDFWVEFWGWLDVGVVPEDFVFSDFVGGGGDNESCAGFEVGVVDFNADRVDIAFPGIGGVDDVLEEVYREGVDAVW